MFSIFMELSPNLEPGSHRPAGPWWNDQGNDQGNDRHRFGALPLTFGRYYSAARGVWHFTPEWLRGNREARPGLK